MATPKEARIYAVTLQSRRAKNSTKSPPRDRCDFIRWVLALVKTDHVFSMTLYWLIYDFVALSTIMLTFILGSTRQQREMRIKGTL